MKIGKLRRRATPDLLARYLEQLPRIKNPREFQHVLRRARIAAAVLGADIEEWVGHFEMPRH